MTGKDSRGIVEGNGGDSASQKSTGADYSLASTWLRQGAVEAVEQLPWGSNYGFIARLRHQGQEHLAIYKPRRGEAPLWDFPQGTLYRRERAAYVVSKAMGWAIVPATIVRSGPLGTGAFQVFVPSDARANFFTLRLAYEAEMKRIAAFDYIANNADRKAGHCLLGSDGRVWAIDHGLTFHVAMKLRTVIWDYAGEPLPDEIIESAAQLRQQLAPYGRLVKSLLRLLSEAEVAAMMRRLGDLLHHGRFPRPHSQYSVPWPLV